MEGPRSSHRSRVRGRHSARRTESRSSEPPETVSGDRIPTLALEPLLLAPLSELWQSYRRVEPRLVDCPFGPEEARHALERVRLAGTSRFESKEARITGDVEAVGADEALYRMLAECLGYSANRDSFRALAEAVPFQLLCGLSLFSAERLLLAAAGITDDDEIISPYIDGPALQPGALTKFRVRPSNSPSSRLRGLARLVHRHRRGLASAIEETAPTDLWRLFVVEADIVLVGRGRADDAAINVALPYLAGEVRDRWVGGPACTSPTAGQSLGSGSAIQAACLRHRISTISSGTPTRLA